MKKIAFLLYVPLLLVTYSCISEFNAQIPNNEYDLLVVDGNIIGDSLLQFSFSKSFSMDEAEPPAGYDDVSVDLVVIGSNGYRSTTATGTGSGTYRLSMGQLEDDVAYGIEFEYSGNTYRSELMKPLHTPAIDEISWSQPTEEGEVSIRVTTHGDQGKTGYYMWQYIEDWEIVSHFYVTAMYDPEENRFYNTYPAPYYYCWRQNYGSEILVASTDKQSENLILNHPLIKKEADDDRFSMLYSVYVKQQAISKAGYEYYLDLSKGDNGMGGLFPPQPSQIESNITCLTDARKKVIGHIEVAHNITTGRIFIPGESITKPALEKCQIIDRDSIDKRLAAGATYLSLYQLGLRPLEYDSYDGKLWSMAPIRCTDCRARKGSKTKPSFWPNDHE
ncbi:DUF4249 family protein [uncultured Alistipes sp.]|jgi:hypothetical protein|uniref:DUF4249 family protein n=1 Tax=uncultured Alistipes sp. TaxID=538949 RepID=UPI0025D460E0|nr:DUF4249 family protein [uncultured Alistipes sp.]